MTNSFAWVSHDRGHSEELVREREKVCWDWLFKGKSTKYIEQKLNDVLPLHVKAVLVPAKGSIIIANPTDPVEMIGAIKEALAMASSQYDAELTLWHSDHSDDPSTVPAQEERIKRGVLPKEGLCFNTLFEGMDLRGIENKLNIVWLNDDTKAIFISSKKSVIFVDKKDPVSIVQRAQELLRTINSGYDIKLVDAPKTKFPLMQAV